MIFLIFNKAECHGINWMSEILRDSLFAAFSEFKIAYRKCFEDGEMNVENIKIVIEYTLDKSMWKWLRRHKNNRIRGIPQKKWMPVLIF